MKALYPAALLLFFCFNAASQQATTNTSGTGQAGAMVIDWSLGELTLVQTVQNGNLLFTQGLHQGRMVSVQNTGGIGAGELLVFPNPAPRTLNLGIGFFETGTLSLRLFSAGGTLLKQSDEAITSFGNKTIDLSFYADGLYLLHAVFTPTNGKPRKNTYRIMHIQ